MSNNIVDLHMHSTASDGTDSPEDLINRIRKASIKVFSLTDHDTISGVNDIKANLPNDITLINGIEFSCKMNSGKCHILAYFYDADNSEFKNVIQHGKELHQTKLKIRLSYLSNLYNIDFSDDDVYELNKIDVVGKPHIVNLLVNKYGLQKDQVYNDLRNCKVSSSRLDSNVVINAILKAGGIPVWAHPLGGEGEKPISKVEFKIMLDELIGYGIKGLECYYSRYNSEQEEMLAHIAKEHDLFISGGSDYHGQNKNIHLGTLNADNVTIPIYKVSILEQVFSKSDNSRSRKAFEIAKTAHKGQVDKAGVDYIYHPMSVAFYVGSGDESFIIVALLHDVVEDTNYTFDELKNKVPLTDEELHALKLVTHGKGLSDEEYIENIKHIKTNALATKVKIADLTHNSDLSRIPEELHTDKVMNNIAKYRKAIAILKS